MIQPFDDTYFMKKIFLLLFIGITSVNCSSQTKLKNAIKNNSQEKNKHLTIKNDSVCFSIKEDADSLFIYSSTFGYEKMELKNNCFSKVYSQDSLDYSYFTYSFYKFKNGIQSSLQNGIHCGKYFPKNPKYVKKLRGNILTVPVKSKWLKENRDIYIYTPNEFDKNKIYSLLFILDANESVLNYQCSLIENLVNERKIDNLIVVGIPNRTQIKDDKYSNEIDFRALEFLENFSASNHSNHHGYLKIPNELENRHNDFINFLENEVYEYVISNYKITNDYYKKCIYGTSNAGAFVVALSRKRPKLFGSNIAFSFGWGDNVKEPNWSGNLPDFYLAVGKYEKGFVQVVEKWKEILDKRNIKYKFRKKLSGHDNVMWDIMFVKYIQEIYSKR